MVARESGIEPLARLDVLAEDTFVAKTEQNGHSLS
jgi:hypothetical protein